MDKHFFVSYFSEAHRKYGTVSNTNHLYHLVERHNITKVFFKLYHSGDLYN